MSPRLRSAVSSGRKNGKKSGNPISQNVSRNDATTATWFKIEYILFSKVAPEEPYDGRSLYDRLKEQRDAKDSEFEEARKFKNMIRGLDVS